MRAGLFAAWYLSYTRDMDLRDTAGYSKKSLSDKLGLQRDTNLAIINAPDHYDDLIGGWPVGCSISRELNEPSFEFIHYFANNQADLRADIADLAQHLDKRGMLWVSWSKQASDEHNNMTEQVIRDLAIPVGLVDVKVCAVDDTWSALKLVWRKKIPS